mmetsp:Transcript_9244/g.10553  ORF Transcript_9244/g.10553 Transcript_9244/m.10553 type:complete len:364 (-) Transcript_9244:214-1305(-)
MKSNSSVLVTATMTVICVAAAVVLSDRIFRRRRRGGDDDKGKKKHSDMKLKDDSHEYLINERFQACVKVMGPQLSRLPQRTQLDYYGLYKQGSLGDCSEYQSSPPPAHDLVAAIKYREWCRLDGMDRMSAMQNYIDKAVHFQFINSITEGDNDEDYELEGDAIIDVMGLGDKPSTLAGEYDDIDALALEDSQYPLHAVAREGRLEELKTLLESSSNEISNKISSNALDVSGQTPLHLAADRGHINCVKSLVLAGADIHSVDHDGISILQAGVISGDKDCCQLLLLLGSNPDQADHDGDTPRDSAQDDKEMRELFEKYDNDDLSMEKLLDPVFIQELQNRNIPIPNVKTTTLEAKRNDINSDTK